MKFLVYSYENKPFTTSNVREIKNIYYNLNLDFEILNKKFNNNTYYLNEVIKKWFQIKNFNKLKKWIIYNFSFDLLKINHPIIYFKLQIFKIKNRKLTLIASIFKILYLKIYLATFKDIYLL